MTGWLIIALRGPFASFADHPGNATRRTGDMPTRSALIGLAAAALGIRREAETEQAALARALVTASAQLQPGTILSDFHTFQSLHQSAKGAPTRAAALRRRDYLETTISQRDYRCDAIWQAGYRLSDSPGSLRLEDLAAAFRAPRFALYIGRRSCPPSHPLNPQLLVHDDVIVAFAAHAAQTSALKGSHARLISLEQRGDARAPNQAAQHWRRDDPRDRSSRWTFADRAEWRVSPQPDPGDAAP